MSRFLITTADERTWAFDRPVLFLGEWCRLYARRQVWEKMDAMVAAPFGLGPERWSNRAAVQSFADRLLPELAAALNQLHGVNHTVRYWHIVIGHWLHRSVAVLFNRFHTTKQALAQNEVTGTVVLDLPQSTLAIPNSLAFVRACNSDTWNHLLFARCIEWLSDIRADRLAATEPPALSSGPAAVRASHARLAVTSLRDALGAALARLARPDDALILNSYLPRATEAALALRLGQVPQLWRSPPPPGPPADPALRQHISLVQKEGNRFEEFVRQQIPDMLPTCFVEGYRDLVASADRLRWPRHAKFVWTSNSFDFDEVFKVWTGARVEEGVPYFAGQHGNNYGTLRGSEHWPEKTASDRFLTWGWRDRDPRTVPAFMFKRPAVRRARESGGLLLIELHSPNWIVPEDAEFEFSLYQEEQFRFTDALPVAIRDRLTVRLHAEYRFQRWGDLGRWADRFPAVHVEPGVRPLAELVDAARLVVHSYDSTGILETLAADIPTLCFWQGGLDHLLPDARPHYERLRAAGIMADSPEDAAATVAACWRDVRRWWDKPKIQDARRAFCSTYARTEAKPARALAGLFSREMKSRAN